MIPLRYLRNFHRLIPDEGHYLHFQWPRLIDTGRCHDSKLCKVTGGFGLWCRPRVRLSRGFTVARYTLAHLTSAKTIENDHWSEKLRLRRSTGPNERSVQRKLILKYINYWCCRYHVSSTSLTALYVVSMLTGGSNSSREPVYTEVTRWQRSAAFESRGRSSFFSWMLNHVSTLSAASTAFFEK